MNSVTIGSSTHARASHDYVPGQEIGQWAIGGPAVFLWGLGLLPYKDTWMSTSATPLNRKSPRPPYTIDTVSERAPLLHTVASIVAGGPVAFGDCVGGPLAKNRQGSNVTSNAAMLQLLARQDGTLLKTDKPGRAVDITWLNRIFNSSGADAARAELWTGSSNVSGMEYGTIFAAAHSTAIMPSLPDLHLPDVDSVRILYYTILYCTLCFAVLGLASLCWGWVCVIYAASALGWLAGWVTGSLNMLSRSDWPCILCACDTQLCGLLDWLVAAYLLGCGLAAWLIGCLVAAAWLLSGWLGRFVG